MTLNTKFLPTIGMKIRSSFNNARKSNVGFSSCEIMKKVYRNATLEKLNNKIEIKEGQIKDLKSNISTLEDDMQSKLNESSDFYTTAQGVLENTDDVEDKVQINKEIASAQNSFNKDMGRINKKIISEQKKLSKAEEGLSIFEQLREEAEKRELEIQKEEEIQKAKEQEELEKQQYNGDKTIKDKENNNQNNTLSNVIEEPSIELSSENLKNEEKKEDNMENKQTDPIENLKNAFNNFITQISKEREEYRKENKELKESNDSLNKQIDEAKQLSQEIGVEATEKVNQANNIIRNEKAKIKDLIEQVKSLKEENNTLKTEKDNLTQENTTLKADKERLEKENTEIKAENKSLSEEISSMKEKQDRMSEELNTIRTQFTSMTNIINQFSSGANQPEMEGHAPYVKQ